MADTEYISKEAALSCFHDWIDRYGHEHTADEMVEYQKIEELPAADVRPVVRAYWIETAPINEETMKPFFVNGPHLKCSNCGSIDFKRKFCPNCGCAMENEK